MTLLFRMIRVLLTARRGALMDESVIDGRVWPTDLDINLHMNNGRFLSVMDLGRADLIARSGLLATLLRRRWMPVLGSATVRYRRSLQVFERYRLRSRVVCWDEKWLYLEHRMETLAGETACLALVKALFRTRSGAIPTAALLHAAGWAGRASPPMPAAFAAWIAAEEEMREPKAA